MAKLVAIGDSLTQGFQSLAVTHTELSFPAIIASRMGLHPSQFPTPNFMGCGGLPLNIEWIARQVESRRGQDISGLEWLGAVWDVADLVDEVEDYWERGKGNESSADVLYHNLAVWGFEVADAYKLNAAICAGRIGSPKDDWFAPPSEPRARTALRVLNPLRTPDRDPDTQIGIAKRIRESEGIENLIVWLGANNCLGTVVSLSVCETTDQPPEPFSKHNLWSVAAFDADFTMLCDKIKEIRAEKVFIGTIPHVTIPPITRGVMKGRGRLPRNRTYYDYYTYFFVKDKDFDPAVHKHLTQEQAEHIDTRIDEYNKIIRLEAQKNGWHIVDTCGLLDDLAVRRNHGTPRRELPPSLADLNVRFFEINTNGTVKNGGLISLDGVHPTTCGYAIVAQEFIEAMQKAGTTVADVDFAAVRRWDNLVSRPPRTLNDMFGMLEMLEQKFRLTQWMK